MSGEVKMTKQEFIEKWKLQPAIGYGNALFDASKQLEADLDSVLADQPDKPTEWNEINAELKRAEQKHPNFPTDMFRQLAIMQEEAGEVTRAVLHYHYEGGTLDHVKEELIQTAAMCLRMLKNLPTPPQKQKKP